MTRGKLLSALDIAEELNTGMATIKFILKRFKKWLPDKPIDGRPFYFRESIGTIINIQECLLSGRLPGEIDQYLDALPSPETNHILNPSFNSLQNEDVRLNKEGVALLKSIFNELSVQQKRIAIAHEKRAEAEERKSLAIEKRAEAEEKKAEAMNNIANALQDMNRFRGQAFEPATQTIAHQAVKALIIDEIDQTDTIPKIDNGFGHLENFDEFKEMNDSLIGMSDCFETDNLSLLIEAEFQNKSNLMDKLDDLSSLLENDFKSEEIAIDDLSALLVNDSLESVASEKLDDLSLLIDETNEIEKTTNDTIHLDNQESMDDLSRLIEPEIVRPVFAEGKKSKKTITIDISPDDVEKYKAAIMKTILEIQADGFSAEEATFLLNSNKIRTISGKPEWSQKAISQIYKIMAGAK